jgi:hypothetical protein
MDTYAVYVAYGINETILEPPTESKFDLLFVLPNKTALASATDINQEDEYELKHTILMPPGVHLGNGTYIFGVKLISKYFSKSEHHLMSRYILDASTTMNLTEYNSSYTVNMYVSKCQYWDDKRFVWSSDGCEVNKISLFWIPNFDH